MGMHSWRSQWAELERLLIAAGATKWSPQGPDEKPLFEIDPPATVQEVEEVERQLGMPIPPSMRRVLLEFSSRVHFEWELPEHHRAPGRARFIYGGVCYWDLKSLPKVHEVHRKWIKYCFTAKSTPDWPDKESNRKAMKYDLVWHDKFPFFHVLNDDILGIDLRPESAESVVYLSHDDNNHGYRLASDFENFVDRLTDIAFYYPECWGEETCLPDAVNGLVADTDVYKSFRQWLAEQAGEA